MKNKLITSAALFLLLTGLNFGQQHLSFGLVGSRFDNLNNEKLTELDKPFGYGIVAAIPLNKDISIAFTGEYFKGDFADNSGTETDIRTHISAYITPFPFKHVKPYLSAGLVFANRQLEYTASSTEETKNIFAARFGAGIDVPVISNLSMNLDFGLYNDGIKINGWSSSIGLRYAAVIF
jgi:hypothetical protein